MAKTDLKSQRILVIVESPNKCKTITEILKKAGYTKAVVMASVGHISNIKDNRASYKNTGIYPDDEFRMNLTVSDDKKEVVKKLKEQATAAKYVYLMTDPDREGAQIAWSLIKFLKLEPEKYRRVVTHEITPAAVIKAIENPIPLEDSLIEAAQARMIIDKLIGYGLSPVARTYIGAKSVGRCQSAGLKLVADREREIQEFKPETYYDLYVDFDKNSTPLRAKYVGTDEEPISHISSKAALNKIIKACDAGDYIVKDISMHERQESPKPPFTTATYQQEAANRLGLKVKDAMSCAQKLFEGIEVNGEHVGLITYMRTDSTDLAEEFIPELKTFIETNYGNVFTTPRKGKKLDTDQEGHEALRCVNPNITPDELTKYITNELLIKVYRLIWQRTIASAMPNAKIAETIYNIYNGEHKFNLTSNTIIDEGYRKIYSYVDEQEPTIKETLAQDEKLINTQLNSAEKQTQPPARYKEASLVKELQRQAIGRPSTFATIVENVLSDSRGYCKLEEKYIVPTERGMQLSAFLDRAFSGVINLNYTKELEADLDLIAEGKLNKLDFLQKFYNELTAAIDANKETGPKQPEKICPKCGAPMVIRRSRFGKLFYGCSTYPKCTGIINAD